MSYPYEDGKRLHPDNTYPDHIGANVILAFGDITTAVIEFADCLTSLHAKVKYPDDSFQSIYRLEEAEAEWTHLTQRQI
jgi:hypothetical protein